MSIETQPTAQCRHLTCKRKIYARTVCKRHYDAAMYQKTPPAPRTCAVCQETFAPRNKDVRYVYCSRVCNDKAQQIKRYGLTVEEYLQMVADQMGLCACCNHPALLGFHIDHNHQTGAVRALLCGGCNAGIGHFREDPRALRAAATYIEEHSA